MLGMHIATDADDPAYSHRTGYGGKVGAYYRSMDCEGN